MRYAPPAVIALLDSNEPFAYVDTYKFTLNDGTILRYCAGQQPVRYQPNNEFAPATYLARGVVISGITMHSTRGLKVDEQNLDISAGPNVFVKGQPFMIAARLGFFDGAILQRDRVYYQTWGGGPLGSITLFIGRTSVIDPAGGTKISMAVKSELVVLDTQMPRNKFQTGCKNTLFDDGCTLDKDAAAVAGNLTVGSTRQLLNWADADAGVFDLGTITFETGPNVGVSRTVRVSTGSQLVLVFPLDFVPGATDQFKAYPGCDLTASTCLNKFANLDNFRGFPYVPTSETGV